MQRQSRRRFTQAQKDKIVSYYKRFGHTATITRYKVSSSVLHNWISAGSGIESSELKQTQAAIVYLEKAARIGLTDIEKGRNVRARIMLSMILLALSSLKGEDDAPL